MPRRKVLKNQTENKFPSIKCIQKGCRKRFYRFQDLMRHLNYKHPAPGNTNAWYYRQTTIVSKECQGYSIQCIRSFISPSSGSGWVLQPRGSTGWCSLGRESVSSLSSLVYLHPGQFPAWSIHSCQCWTSGKRERALI